MKRLKNWILDLSGSMLISLAMATLVFPPQLLAERALLSGKPFTTSSFKIDVHELTESGFPSRMTVSTGDRKINFVYEDGQFHWQDFEKAEVRGSRALPSLEKMLSWEVKSQPDGWFEAALPIDQLMPPLPKTEKTLFDKSQEILRSTALPPSMVDVLGKFDSATNTLLATVMLPDSNLLDFEISLPAGASFGTEPTEKAIIVIVPFAVILAIVGTAVAACLIMFSACYLGCSLACGTGGVRNVNSAICGVGCECSCNPSTGDGSNSCEPNLPCETTGF